MENLQKKKVKELKDLLKLQELPLKGNKAQLIKRLQEYSGKPKPEKAWQYSQAKIDLKKALLDPTSPFHTMSAEQVHNSDIKYKQYPLFEDYFVEMKELVAKEKKDVEMDDLAAKMWRLHFPREEHNKRGYPFWDTHKAKALLKEDVANNKHNEMKPKALRNTRVEYMEFPENIFRERVNSEARKHREKAFWQHARNNKKLKNHVKNRVDSDRIGE